MESHTNYGEKQFETCFEFLQKVATVSKDFIVQ